MIHGDVLIVNWDHEGQSFLVALNPATGETRWKVDRDEGTAWSTPLLVTHDGRTQIIINGQARLHSYDLATGELIWEYGRERAAGVASPVSVNGLVFCMTGYPEKSLQAVPLDSTGKHCRPKRTHSESTDSPGFTRNADRGDHPPVSRLRRTDRSKALPNGRRPSGSSDRRGID